MNVMELLNQVINNILCIQSLELEEDYKEYINGIETRIVQYVHQY